MALLEVLHVCLVPAVVPAPGPSQQVRTHEFVSWNISKQVFLGHTDLTVPSACPNPLSLRSALCGQCQPTRSLHGVGATGISCHPRSSQIRRFRLSRTWAWGKPGSSAQTQSASLRTRYPSGSPFRTGHVQVSDVHQVYFEQYGNPCGMPALFVHGGPGASCFQRHACALSSPIQHPLRGPCQHSLRQYHPEATRVVQPVTLPAGLV